MPEHPLQNWEDWGLPFSQTPDLIRELTAGFTNRNYVIEADSQLWVLRINADNSHELGIDRQREKLILEAASTAGLAPQVLDCSVEHGILVTEFIGGPHWQTSELSDPVKLSLLLDNLARVHLLPVTTPRFDYQAHAENYWRLLVEKKIRVTDELCRRREKILLLIDAIPVSNVICHHDPNPKNVIEHSGKLCFLDWEYAAPAWPAFDYAALAREWDIPPEQLVLPDAVDNDEIQQALELYNYLCDLWSLLQGD